MYINSKSTVCLDNQNISTFIQDITEGINGTVSSYTFNLTFSNPECDSILITFTATSCNSGVCTLEDNTIIRCFNESSEVVVTVFASNILGDGITSDPILVGKNTTIYACMTFNISLSFTHCECVYIETSNELLLFAYFEASNNTFICQFLQRYFDNKSCIIKYGTINITSQSCDIRSETRNSSNNTLTDIVTVSLPTSMLTLLPTESELCFVAIGNIANFTIAVEGRFRIPAAGRG